MRCLTIGALLLVSVFMAPDVRAQSGTITVSYNPGWNMVGGPSGTNLSIVGKLYAYGPSGYSMLTTTTAIACQGYWVYVNSTATASVPRSATGPTKDCSLRSGWNLIGNPFGGVAQLPAGTVAYHWSPGGGRYTPASSIPVGGADWIYSGSGGSTTLQFTQASSGDLVIDGLTNLGPYQVHVGYTVTLVVPSGLGVSADAPSSLLQFESSGEGTAGTYWTWRAVAPGTAPIGLLITCRPLKPPCDVPAELEIEVVILP
jgi:hypothetical protein